MSTSPKLKKPITITITDVNEAIALAHLYNHPRAVLKNGAKNAGHNCFNNETQSNSFEWSSGRWGELTDGIRDSGYDYSKGFIDGAKQSGEICFRYVNGANEYSVTSGAYSSSACMDGVRRLLRLLGHKSIKPPRTFTLKYKLGGGGRGWLEINENGNHDLNLTIRGKSFTFYVLNSLYLMFKQLSPNSKPIYISLKK